MWVPTYILKTTRIHDHNLGLIGASNMENKILKQNLFQKDNFVREKITQNILEKTSRLLGVVITMHVLFGFSAIYVNII